MKNTQKTVSWCQSFITESLPFCYPTIENTAGQLGMPVRTLQRRLQQDGTSYSQLVEETRFEMACRLLIAHNARVSSVAKTLGYNDPGSFSRAFQRWAGISPREYRRQFRSRKGAES